MLANASVRCWGYGADGELGYGDTNNVGDDETPGSVGPVDLGTGRTAMAVAAGDFHVCAVLDDGRVRCWGFGGNGRLGYGNTTSIGDDETPGSVGPVDLGTGRTATAISAGASHTCALLADASVRCWGYGFDGQLGYGNKLPNDPNSIGDDETPGSVGPVNLGPGRTATAISAGGRHTCALLDDGTVRCWGAGGGGALGYGNNLDIGDDEAPGSVDPVNLGPGAMARAIASGGAHTCALLDDGNVRCWGYGGNGELGTGNQSSIGDNEAPGSVPPVDLGPGRTAVAISAGDHTCALLDNGRVRCWGYGGTGQLGYGNTSNIGDNETPGSVAPVDLGTGRSATSISAGRTQTCAKLDDSNVRCWGYGGNGRLGNCNATNIGDDEAPGAAGPVDLETPGSPCVPLGGGSSRGGGRPPGPSGNKTVGDPAPSPTATVTRGDPDSLALERQRSRDLGSCLARANREARRQRDRARLTCLKRYGRTPGRVKGLNGRAASKTKIVLTFTAPGSDGARPPAARAYLVKQSPTPIRGARDFARAQTLCNGTCRFKKLIRVGTKVNLTINALRPKTTYYYAIAARDNVSKRLGPRSALAKAKTR